MFGARFNHETRFFIASGESGKYELSGIESIDLSHQTPTAIAKPLGTRKGLTTIGGAVEQDLSISRSLIYNDPVLDFTGDVVSSGMSASIFYGNKTYGFNSGYLTDYSVNCAVGSIPKVNASFKIFSEMKSGITASGSSNVTHPNIFIPSQGSISLTCDNGYHDVTTTNRVVGFDYAIKCKRNPIYTLGRSSPFKVHYVPPLEYAASVQVEVDDTMLQSGFNLLTGRENRDLTFTINGRDGDSLQSLTVPKASLVSEQLNSTAEGVLKLTLNYIGHS